MRTWTKLAYTLAFVALFIFIVKRGNHGGRSRAQLAVHARRKSEEPLAWPDIPSGIEGYESMPECSWSGDGYALAPEPDMRGVRGGTTPDPSDLG